ncbi:MAG TPA: SHOCT domain-containing protein [Nakamurella multipartita]|nr:SHOCT domain-containing protein [Nakamurella multipartita]
MGLAMLVFWGAVIWLIVSLTATWSKPDVPTPTDRAEQVLADRFAAGEITAAEYQERLCVLRGNRGEHPRRLNKNGAPQ